MQGVTAIAVNVATSPVPWLAAAHRVSKRTVRVTVYELIPGISLASGMHAPPAQQIYQADLTEPLLVKVDLPRVTCCAGSLCSLTAAVNLLSNFLFSSNRKSCQS